MASTLNQRFFNVQKVVCTRSCLTMMLGILLLLLPHTEAQSFDFFYFVQQWPGSFCATSRSCCFPVTGKPAADFSIHGLWPNNKDGTYPSNCNPGDAFSSSKISGIVSELNTYWPSLACPSSNDNKFWKHEWTKHGTCSNVDGEYAYFQAALTLRTSIDLLGALQKAGIQPDNGSYSAAKIQTAITQYLGYKAGITCNTAAAGQTQLFQVFVCVAAADASQVIDCPVLPSSECTTEIVFPSF